MASVQVGVEVRVGMVALDRLVLVSTVLSESVVMPAVKPRALFEVISILIVLRRNWSTSPDAQVDGVVTETDKISLTLTSKVVSVAETKEKRGGNTKKEVPTSITTSKILLIFLNTYLL